MPVIGHPAGGRQFDRVALLALAELSLEGVMVLFPVKGRTTWFVWTYVECPSRLTSPTVSALPYGTRMALGPESVHRQRLAEVVGAKLQVRLSTCGGPELLARLDPVIDLFDRRLDRACGNRLDQFSASRPGLFLSIFSSPNRIQVDQGEVRIMYGVQPRPVALGLDSGTSSKIVRSLCLQPQPPAPDGGSAKKTKVAAFDPHFAIHRA